MGTHMKTTIEISNDLLARTRKLAQREGTTLRALMEEGLRLALRARRGKDSRKPFKMITFKGDGLTEEFRGASWEHIRGEIYGGREDKILRTVRGGRG